jgi:hypothetical protein
VDPLNVGDITTVWDWINQVNAATFAGRTDWRLPSEGGNNSPSTGGKELETILLAPYPCGTDPCIDPIFGAGAGGSYYSASTYAPYPFAVWHVGFNQGTVTFGGKGDFGYVRAVR